MTGNALLHPLRYTSVLRFLTLSLSCLTSKHRRELRSWSSTVTMIWTLWYCLKCGVMRVSVLIWPQLTTVYIHSPVPVMEEGLLWSLRYLCWLTLHLALISLLYTHHLNLLMQDIHCQTKTFILCVYLDHHPTPQIDWQRVFVRISQFDYCNTLSGIPVVIGDFNVHFDEKPPICTPKWSLTFLYLPVLSEERYV